MVVTKTPRYVSFITSVNKTSLKELTELVYDVINEKQPLQVPLDYVLEQIGITMKIQGGQTMILPGGGNQGTCQRVPVSGKNKGIRCPEPADPINGQGRVCLKCLKTQQGKALLDAPIQQSFGGYVAPMGQSQTNYVQPNDSLFKPVTANPMMTQNRTTDVVRQEDAIALIPEYSIYVLARTPGVITTQSGGVHQLIGKLSADKRSIEELTPSDVSQLYQLAIMGLNSRNAITGRILEVYSDPARLARFNDALAKAWSDNINVKGAIVQNPQIQNPGITQNPPQIQQYPPQNPGIIQNPGITQIQQNPPQIQQYPMQQYPPQIQQIQQQMDPLMIPIGSGPAIGESSSTDEVAAVNSLAVDLNTVKITDDELDSIEEITFESPAPEEEATSVTTNTAPFIENLDF